MKTTAHLIISQEYRLNSPSVFLLLDGNYYGCLLYPRARKFPELEYWYTATSSDSHREFTVKEVDLTSEQIEKIKELNSIRDNAAKQIIRTSWPYIKNPFKRKNSKEQKEYQKLMDEQNQLVLEEFARNAPFEKVWDASFRELRTLLLSLI